MSHTEDLQRFQQEYEFGLCRSNGCPHKAHVFLAVKTAVGLFTRGFCLGHLWKGRGLLLEISEKMGVEQIPPEKTAEGPNG